MTYLISFAIVGRAKLDVLLQAIDIVMLLALKQMIGYHLFRGVGVNVGYSSSMAGAWAWITSRPPGPLFYLCHSDTKAPGIRDFVLYLGGSCMEFTENQKVNLRILAEKNLGIKGVRGI